jgi:exonuclease III
VREVRDLAKDYAPSVLCLLETQIDKKRVEGLARTLGFDNSFAVSSQGRSGGLGLFWNNEINLEVLPYSQYHIDAIISSPTMEQWRLTCVYGEARVSERYKMWDLLKFLRSSSPLPWVCMGDFNEVLHREEHQGVNERSYAQIMEFRETMDVCGLADLGYTGIPWTFEKKVAGGTYCRVRLDRALASPCWSARYPMAEVKHLASIAMSDHLPILLELEPREPREQRHQHVFRYETMWESHSDFDRMLAQAWAVQTEGEPLQALQSKMLDVSGALSVWGKETFGHVRSEIKKLKRELDRMRTEPTRVGPSYEETKVVCRLAELHHREETMWKQRSRVQWLSEGDKNTHFFHQRANRRRKKNKIEKLKKSDGSMTEDVQELKTLSRNFYIDLYTSEETTGMEEVLAAVDPSVTPEMNARLLAPFDGAEIKTALFQMFPTKAPGPDGFPAYFFQRHWDLCGEEVTKAVLKILNGEDSPEIINNTFIVLIPKVARPESWASFVLSAFATSFIRLRLRYWPIG